MRLREDGRWQSLFALDSFAKRRIFDDHVANLMRKKADAFAAMLDSERGVTLGMAWDEARALVCSDPRFVRFSDDDAEREAE